MTGGAASPGWRGRAADLARRRPALVFALVAMAAVAVHGHSLLNGFVMDDKEIVLDNPLNRSVTHLWTILTSMDALKPGAPLPYYRPLSRVTYLVDHQLFGLEPWGYHLTNLLGQVGAVLLLLVVARRLLRAWLPSVVVALLLAVHPIHAEAVNWVSASNNLFATCCVLAAFEATRLEWERGRGTWGVLPGLFFFAGTLFKETAVMLLPLLVLVPLTSGGSPFQAIRARWRSLTVTSLAAGTYLLLRSLVLPAAASRQVTGETLRQAFSNIFYAVPRYAENLVLPTHLTILYRFPQEYPSSAWLPWAFWPALALIATLLWRQGRPPTRLGLLWAALFYFPVSTIIPFPANPLADRFIYLPAIGAWLVLGDQLALLLEGGRLRRVAGIAAAVLLVGLAGLSVRRTRQWRDMATLLEAAVQVDPGWAVPHFNLGVEYLERGRADEARAEWQRTLQLDDRHVQALELLGTYYVERDSLQEAERCYARLVALQPGDADSHFNLALIMEKTQRPAEALEQYRRFIATEAGRRPDLAFQVQGHIRELEARTGATVGPGR